VEKEVNPPQKPIINKYLIFSSNFPEKLKKTPIKKHPKKLIKNVAKGNFP
jgi:hypothetical protein